MRKGALFLLLLLSLLSAMTGYALADEPTVIDGSQTIVVVAKSYDKFYWERKSEIGFYFVGLVCLSDNNEKRVTGLTLARLGRWYGAYHNDRILLVNVGLDFILTGLPVPDGPSYALGVGFSPLAFRITGHKKLLRGVAADWYVKPTYIYLTGLNGTIKHRHAFGVQVTIAFV